MAIIKIGDAVSLGAVNHWTYTPDDRQTKVDVIDGAVVQDFGYQEQGDKMTCSATFSPDDYAKLVSIQKNRTLVTVVDEGGNSLDSCRVMIKQWNYVEHFPKIRDVTIEIWRV